MGDAFCFIHYMSIRYDFYMTRGKAANQKQLTASHNGQHFALISGRWFPAVSIKTPVLRPILITYIHLLFEKS